MHYLQEPLSLCVRSAFIKRETEWSGSHHSAKDVLVHCIVINSLPRPIHIKSTMPFWSRIQFARRRMNGTEATALIKWTWEAIVIRLCAVEDPDYADGILKAAAVAVLSKIS